jgi:hypothetical protein
MSGSFPARRPKRKNVTAGVVAGNGFESFRAALRPLGAQVNTQKTKSAPNKCLITLAIAVRPCFANIRSTNAKHE